MSPGGVPPFSALSLEGPLPDLSKPPRAQQGMAPFTPSPGGPPPVRDMGVPAGPPLYPAIVPVQQQFSPLPARPGLEIRP